MQALLKEIEQLHLFDDDKDDGTALLFLEERKSHGRNTGERMQRDEATYAVIVELLGKSMSLREVAAIATKVRGTKIAISKNTIAAIRDREGLAIGTYKKRTLGHLDSFVDRASERLADEVDSIPIGQLAVPLGIAMQRAADLRGEPNVRIEHSISKLYNFDDFVNGLPVADVLEEHTIKGISSGNDATILPAPEVSRQKASGFAIYTRKGKDRG